jgi:hypothetical protein
MPPKTTSPQDESRTTWLLGIAFVAALALAVFARFKALGAAPLAVDEFFIVRSTQNLLRHGLPQFDCGGLYGRGLLLQYLAALLDLLGVRVDVAPRLVSAVSSLIALPAAYLIGRRVGGARLGLLAVIVLAFSVWEAEMARFGRMYAPFQAVFLWYVFYFLRRTADDERWAQWPMIALTLLGGLLWEGAVFMALANFIPIFLQRRSLRLSLREWTALIKFVLVLAAVYLFVTTDFRLLGASQALPAGYDSDAADAAATASFTAPPLWHALLGNRVWLPLFLVPLAASAAAMRTLWLRGAADWAAVGLMVALTAALAHQFAVAAAVLGLLLVSGFVTTAELNSRAARSVYLAIAVCALFWIGFEAILWNRPVGFVLWKAVLSFIFPLVSLPDFIDQVLRPWAGAVPMLGLGLLVLLGVACVRVVRRKEAGVSDERALLVLILCLGFAACASDTPRHETRYVFFLYPAAIILALASLTALLEPARWRERSLGFATVAVAIGVFMLSEDFQPRHLLEIDRPASIFRTGLSPAAQEHLVVRDDTPALAQWLSRHAAAAGDVVVNAYQSLDYYDPRIDYFYVDHTDFNFESYACERGTIDRWSNRPLLQSVPAIASIIGSSSRTYLVTYSSRLAALLPQLMAFHPRIEWAAGNLSVVAFNAGRSSGADSH